MSSASFVLFTICVLLQSFLSSSYVPNAEITLPSIRKPRSFSVPLKTSRPEPTTFLGTLNQLWNDPRPATSSVGEAFSSNSGVSETENGDQNDIPYCIVSDEFEIAPSEKFRVLLYPRGRFASSGTTSKTTVGPAAAYLRYVPSEYGNEVDIAWKLRLVDERTGHALPIFTSGGLPKSNDTWSAAMTFCSENEDLESAGRAADWGASTWFAPNVCESLGYLKAEVDITLFDQRTGESSLSWPPAKRGAVGAIKKLATEAAKRDDRTFRVGEVIVPMETKDAVLRKALDTCFILPGTDYRIMTMSDKDGNAIFSTESLPKEERQYARLAVRPCGWKNQQRSWQKRGMKQAAWPTEVDAGLLMSSMALSRFNPASALPRASSAFTRDAASLILALTIALVPIPLTLGARNFVSLYFIPSASMDPTLQKGDVLLVEKFPGTFARTKRGDVILFHPPPSLQEIIGDNAIRGNSLFVKRVVGMPGDTDIVMNPETTEVRIGGNPAVGPDRNLCGDEPLRLIDRLLENGRGKDIAELGDEDVYVLGDCKTVSVDSRVFGVLPKENVAGKPLARIWPLNRIR